MSSKLVVPRRARADLGMAPHLRPLGVGQRSGLAQDRVPDADLADVVEQVREAHAFGVVGVEPELSPGCSSTTPGRRDRASSGATLLVTSRCSARFFFVRNESTH